MNRRILVTGGSGLIGTALTPALEARGVAVVRLDLRATGDAHGDVRDPSRVRRAIENCDGVVHLAAVSRVIWGERDPALCSATNVGGLRNVLDAARDVGVATGRSPWLVFASSREIYGQPDRLPAGEDCPARPVNVYGRTKVEGERLVEVARRDGLRACVVRFSNVYGAVADHADRVVPAFARAALAGEPLRVDGPDHTFDFTHVRDVVRGLAALVELLAAGEPAPPPIHLVSGVPTTLGELARLAIELAGSRAAVQVAPPRAYDVARFWGDPARAHALLGWSATVPLRDGLAGLIADLAAVRAGAEAAMEATAP